MQTYEYHAPGTITSEYIIFITHKKSFIRGPDIFFPDRMRHILTPRGRMLKLATHARVTPFVPTRAYVRVRTDGCVLTCHTLRKYMHSRMRITDEEIE